MQCNVGGCSKLKLLLKSNTHGKVAGVCLRVFDMAIVLVVCPPCSRPCLVCAGTVSWAHLGCDGESV